MISNAAQAWYRFYDRRGFRRRMFRTEPTAQPMAEEKARSILERNSTPAQWKQFCRTLAMTVVGGTTGNEYDIGTGYTYLVGHPEKPEYSPYISRYALIFCSQPAWGTTGYIQPADIVLAKKLWLEHNELAYLAVAMNVGEGCQCPSCFRKVHALHRINTDEIIQRLHEMRY